MISRDEGNLIPNMESMVFWARIKEMADIKEIMRIRVMEGGSWMGKVYLIMIVMQRLEILLMKGVILAVILR